MHIVFREGAIEEEKELNDYSGNNNKIQKIMNAATIALITAALAAALIITNITTNAAAVSSASKQAPLCSSGTTFNLSYARCEASPICPIDTTLQRVVSAKHNQV